MLESRALEISQTSRAIKYVLVRSIRYIFFFERVINMHLSYVFEYDCLSFLAL